MFISLAGCGRAARLCGALLDAIGTVRAPEQCPGTSWIPLGYRHAVVSKFQTFFENYIPVVFLGISSRLKTPVEFDSNCKRAVEGESYSGSLAG